MIIIGIVIFEMSVIRMLAHSYGLVIIHVFNE